MWLGSENLIFRKNYHRNNYNVYCILLLDRSYCIFPLSSTSARSMSLVHVPEHLPFLAAIIYFIKTELKQPLISFHLIILLSKRNRRFLVSLSGCIRLSTSFCLHSDWCGPRGELHAASNLVNRPAPHTIQSGMHTYELENLPDLIG
jgi:hypothetical protein